MTTLLPIYEGGFSNKANFMTMLLPIYFTGQSVIKHKNQYLFIIVYYALNSSYAK